MMAITLMPSNHFQILLITSLLLVSSTHLFRKAESSTSIVSGIDFDFDLGTLLASAHKPSCDGTIGGCVVDQDDEEFMVDSESSRRILARRGRYISYGALRRNRVPCSRRGASYYNCRPGGSANPYRRGCSHISRCRR